MRCSSACSKAFGFANATPAGHGRSWHSTRGGGGRAAFIVPGYATRVPYRRVNHGAERTTTVTTIRPLSWPCHPLPA
jgi:hypothetical protein